MPTHLTDNLTPEAGAIPSRTDVVSAPILAHDPAAPVVARTDHTNLLVFQVDSVDKTDAPGGDQHDDWYRYVLRNHRSTINGLRRGTRQHVCDYAAQYAEQLNMRIVFCSPSWSARNSKTAPTKKPAMLQAMKDTSTLHGQT